MKSIEGLTPEQIKKYNVITPEQAQAEIENINKDKTIIEERANKVEFITPEMILIERIDYRERGSAILSNEKQMSFNRDHSDPAHLNKGAGKIQRIMNSVYAKILKVGDPADNDVSKNTFNKLKVGSFVIVNSETPFCPNLLDWDNNGKYDDLYKSIWMICYGNILFIDEEHQKFDYYALKIKGVETRQEMSVESALNLIENEGKTDEGGSTSDTLKELRSSIFEDGPMLGGVVWKEGAPTPKFGK